MNRSFDIPDDKKIRVILDTDAACEADDPFAIVHALLSPKLIVRGIVAEHFAEEGSMEKSFREIKTILELLNDDTPAYRGQEHPMKGSSQNTSDLSEGVLRIIDEALCQDEHPLFVLCQGAITNVACAIRKNPAIINKMTVIWIGTHGCAPKTAPFREFNAGNDIAAANYVLESGVPLWIVPSDVYATMTIGIAEILRRIKPCGKIGEHLYTNLIDYNNSEYAGWTKGESWSLGDSPAVGLALNPDCGKYDILPAPFIEDDTSSSIRDGSHSNKIRIYRDVDSRYILEDFIAKLELWALS